MPVRLALPVPNPGIPRMTLTIGALLALSFLISVLGLFLFIWAQTRGLMCAGPAAAEVIFAADEVGVVEDPAAPELQLAALQAVGRAAEGESCTGTAPHTLAPDACEARFKQDRSSRQPAFAFLMSSIVWLVLGSLAGLIASQKLTSPDFLTQSAWLTFGRIRTVHLNMVAYGWASLAGLGVVPRLLGAELVGARFAIGDAADVARDIARKVRIPETEVFGEQSPG
ncbi:cbb3-type cytochrome c oxidase subunit I [Paraburkholderia tagetis]|uniref:Cytochrome-c oxidase n=1 Tax=Paraburkholderia tagetis TaxID=2913261 RepID=A0A9X1UPK8_9BURK|nr:cbb3-type cytochrome c oxidase subunit I [Paraburkholderia tagetis]MCG5078841.1 hypothetical protein [Paraburkholderia tagetis]